MKGWKVGGFFHFILPVVVDATSKSVSAFASLSSLSSLTNTSSTSLSLPSLRLLRMDVGMFSLRFPVEDRSIVASSRSSDLGEGESSAWWKLRLRPSFCPMEAARLRRSRAAARQYMKVMSVIWRSEERGGEKERKEESKRKKKTRCKKKEAKAK